MMLLCDRSSEAVVVATEIVPVAVAVVVPFNVTEEGTTAHVTYDTGLLQVSATAPANPPTGAIVKVIVPKLPGATEIVLAEAVRFTGVLATVNVWLELTEGA